MEQIQITLPKKKRKKIVTTFKEPSLTKQADGPGCDIGMIMRRYTETGQAPQMSSRPIHYGESQGDFHALQLGIAQAKTLFENLPQESQDIYGDYSGMINAIETDEGRSQLVQDGLLDQFDIKTPPQLENAPESAPGAADNEAQAEVSVDQDATVNA